MADQNKSIERLLSNARNVGGDVGSADGYLNQAEVYAQELGIEVLVAEIDGIRKSALDQGVNSLLGIAKRQALGGNVTGPAGALSRLEIAKEYTQRAEGLDLDLTSYWKNSRKDFRGHPELIAIVDEVIAIPSR